MRSAPLEAGLPGKYSVPSAGAKKTMNLKRDRPLIAIVDDDESVCLAIKRLLSAHGMDAATFLSGHEFIDLLDVTPSFRPDCVILDVRMPGLSGLEVQQLLVSRQFNIPVIFVTAAYEDQIALALAAGAAAVFRKPVTANVLLPTLRLAIGFDGKERS